MNWIEIKALEHLYHYGSVSLNRTLRNSDELNYLADSLNLLERRVREFRTCPDYYSYYEQKFQSKYLNYRDFLESYDVLKPQSRYEEKDILALMEVDEMKRNGTLEEIRQQIIAANETIRGVSTMFFKNDKHLEGKSSLIDALKKIIEVEEFASEKDQQYIYKLECHHPKAIVLCENLDFLKKPVKPREYGIELWYAGGKNVEKLRYADTRGLPIYYSCDWDFDGIFVIYPLVAQKLPMIRLLTPNGVPRGIDETEHDSRWERLKKDVDYFLSDPEHIRIVRQLIEQDQWIIEESNDLMKMLGVE